MNNKVIKVATSVLKVITSFLIIIVISIIFIQRISGNKVTLFGYSMFTIVSESMLPKYEVWDMVLAKKVSPELIKVGDDVVYLGEKSNLKDKIITHQVIKKEYQNGSYIFETKGLANNVSDPEIKDSQIYGVVLRKSKILSFLSHAVNNIYGFYFIVFVPFAILLFLEIFDIIKERKIFKEMKKKKQQELENKESIPNPKDNIQVKNPNTKKLKKLDLGD